jgi:hypothetical protein
MSQSSPDAITKVMAATTDMTNSDAWRALTQMLTGGKPGKPFQPPRARTDDISGVGV